MGSCASERIWTREDDGGGEPRCSQTEEQKVCGDDEDDGAILPRRVYDESAYFGDEMPYIKF